MKKILAGLLLSNAAFALDTKPWYNDLYDFELTANYIYSQYRKVEGASTQLKRLAKTNDLFLDLSFTAQTVDIQLETEFATTQREVFGNCSDALQLRYKWLDDIAGDPVSFVTGLNFRFVTSRFLTDVNIPYAANANLELTFSLGKEWSDGKHWTMRTYGLIALGQGNRGYPWTRELFVWQRKWNNHHVLTLSAESDIGFGGKQHINVDHFYGWSKVQHRSIDLGLGYGYHFDLWGTLSASYAYRVWAHNFPEKVNFFMLEYTLPFSLF